MTKLTEQDIVVHKEASRNYHAIEDKFNNRIEEVIRLVHKVFKTPFVSYYYYGAEEGQLGTVRSDDLYDRDAWIEFVRNDAVSSKMTLDDVCYQYAIPSAFLYMDNEQIVAQIQAEIEADRQGKERLAVKRQDRYKKDAELVQSAKKKLTKAERKALGIK